MPINIQSAAPSQTRRMRSYVRRWVNEWDLRRLYPAENVATDEEEIRPTYEEDTSLESSGELAQLGPGE